MQKLKLLLVFVMGIVVLYSFSGIQGCKSLDNSVSVPTTTSDIGFSVGDSLTGGDLVGDSAFVGQALMFIPRVLNFTPTKYEWNYGDGSPIDTHKIGQKKYYQIASYTTCLKVTDAQGSVRNYCGLPLRIVPTSTSGNYIPLLKKLTATISGNNITATMGLLKKSIQCNNFSNPFIIFANGTWTPLPLNLNDTTADGYIRYSQVFQNNTAYKFTFGGSFAGNCWASIRPTPPFWTSAHYLSGEDLLGVYWSDTTMQTIGGGPISNMPGIVGDEGSTPVVRFDFYNDTLFVFMHKDRVVGDATAPFWVNSLTGLSNPQSLANAPNYSSWWLGKIQRDMIPLGVTMQFKYGGRWNNGVYTTNMSSSYYWNGQYGALEIRPYEVGGRPAGIIIKTPMGEYKLEFDKARPHN